MPVREPLDGAVGSTILEQVFLGKESPAWARESAIEPQPP